MDRDVSPELLAAPLPALSTVVIGAGVAGLTAARTLRAHGANVAVLEARDRVGGRIHTVQEDGLSIDLGASWIHGVDDNPLAGLVQLLGISTTEFSVGSFQAADPRIEYFDAAGQRLDEERRARFLEDLRAVDADLVAAVRSATPGVSFADVSRAVLAATGWDGARQEQVRQHLQHRVEDLSGAAFGALDAHGLDEEHVGGDEVVFPGGYFEIVRALSAGLDVRLEHVVTDVVLQSDDVLVRTRSHGDVRTDHVVITVPVGVLRAGSIRFDPPLPPHYRRALEGIGMGVYDKVVFRFPARFWGRAGVLRQQGGERGVRWHSWYDLSAGTDHAVLAALVGGPFARELEDWTDDQITRDGLAALRVLFGDEVLEPSTVHVSRWYQDPYALGSYSHLLTGSSSADREVLATPIGGTRLQFAGEATSTQDPATVHGAMAAGARAAQRILRAGTVREVGPRWTVDAAQSENDAVMADPTTLDTKMT